jgi:hypothetical protein
MISSPRPTLIRAFLWLQTEQLKKTPSLSIAGSAAGTGHTMPHFRQVHIDTSTGMEGILA